MAEPGWPAGVTGGPRAEESRGLALVAPASRPVAARDRALSLAGRARRLRIGALDEAVADRTERAAEAAVVDTCQHL